jgi:hypothetical protein
MNVVDPLLTVFEGKRGTGGGRHLTGAGVRVLLSANEGQQ